LAKVNTTALINLRKFVKDIPKSIDDRTTKIIALSVREKMLDLISRGISPILGNGRFPGYKRAGDKDGYPKNVRKKFPDKRNRPVNLFLSGDFLESIKASGRNLIVKIEITGSKNKLKEQGHRERAGGQPARPIIPSENEEFNATIKQMILKMMKAAVKSAVKRGA
jgi:hypothetical protein